MIHYAVDGHDAVDALADRIGLAWQGGKSAFRHGPLDVDFSGSKHPITRGLGKLRLVDESYWNLIGDPASVEVLGTGVEAGQSRPLFLDAQGGQRASLREHPRPFHLGRLTIRCFDCSCCEESPGPPGSRLTGSMSWSLWARELANERPELRSVARAAEVDRLFVEDGFFHVKALAAIPEYLFGGALTRGNARLREQPAAQDQGR